MSDQPESPYDNPKSEPLFMLLTKEVVAAARGRAQESQDAFRQAMIARTYPEAFFCVKAHFPEADGSPGANLWLGVRELRTDGYLCEPFELPKGFTGLQPGQQVLLTPEGIDDWMIMDGGTLYGGYTLRAQRSLVPEPEKAKYDTFLGVTTYSETLP